MPIEDGNEVRLYPPGGDVCTMCATKHKKDEPHNIRSLYYQYVFYRNNGRFPTWRDAIAHCPDDVKERWEQRLKAQGISLDKTGRDDKKDD